MYEHDALEDDDEADENKEVEVKLEEDEGDE
jgi:hypothetical protein